MLEKLGLLFLSCDYIQGDCKDEHHCTEINTYCDKLVAGLKSVIEQIGLKSVSRVCTKIIWSDKLRKLKQQSTNFHALWKMIGKPRDDVVNKERFRVKGLYNSCIMRHKREADESNKQRLELKLANGNTRGFWKGWRSFKKSDKVSKKQVISGQSDNKAVCNGL